MTAAERRAAPVRAAVPDPCDATPTPAVTDTSTATSTATVAADDGDQGNPPGQDGQLPATGNSVWPIVMWASAAVLIGSLFVALRRPDDTGSAS